jgi:uncharacterized damage-inducible protein DinB
MTQLSIACLRILEQLEDAVAGISQQEFTRSSITLSGATIGQHIRHTIEFFVCLEEGFGSGVINYDKRAHDKSIEMDKTRALVTLAGIRTFISNSADNKKLMLEGAYDTNSTEVYTIETNYLRELAYNIEHTVHHMAIMKIGLREMAPYVELPADFGVAASTTRHQAVMSYHS